MSADYLQGRPALFAFLLFGGGIAAERSYLGFGNPDASHLLPLVLVALFSCCILCSTIVLVRRLAVMRVLAIGLALISLGVLFAATPDLERENSTLAKFARLKLSEVHVNGKIAEVRESDPTSKSILLECDTLQIEESRVFAPGVLELEVLLDSATGGKELVRGATMSMVGELSPLLPPTNPYEYPRDLRNRDLHGALAKMSIRSSYDYSVAPLNPQPSFWQSVRSIAEAIRKHSIAALDTAIRDTSSRAFVEAVVIGERRDLPDDTKNDFTSAGVSHILAVSGFNVAIVALLINQLLRMFGFGRRLPRTILAMIGVAAYALVVGLEPSVVRALIMIELLFAARLLERKPDPLNIVASAALLTLLVQPFDLFDAGFQLSYAAVFGIAIVYPEIKRLLGLNETGLSTLARLRRMNEAVAVSIAATVATLPVTVWQFHRFSLVGTLTNLPVIPLASLITVLGFLIVPITIVLPRVGRLYGDGAEFLTQVLFKLTHAAAHVPRASIALAQPSLIYIALFIILVLYCIRAASTQHLLARVFLSAAIVGSVWLVVPFRTPIIQPSGELSILAFDVGQADCILITTPTGKKYLMDFGGANVANTSRAERAVLPFMQAEGITHLDGGFITHMHRDHYGGAPFLIDHLGVERLFWTGERVQDQLAHDLDRSVRAARVSTQRLTAGQRLTLDSETTLYVLHPPKALVDGRGPRLGARLNNGSLAAKLVYRNSSVLFLGDIEQVDEEMLVREYGSFLKSDVVKVAHHGSAGSVGREFIETVAARFAMFSVGEHNRYGHPARLALQRWYKRGARILRTDRQGAILLESNGARFKLRNWQGS